MTRASAHSVLRGEFSASFDTACSAPTRKQPPGTADCVGRDRVLNHDRILRLKAILIEITLWKFPPCHRGLNIKRKALAFIAFVLTILFSAELSAASGSRHFGRSGRFAEHFKQSGGFRQTLGGHGFRSSWDSRRAHPRHFDGHRHFDYRKRFTPHHRFGHRPILPLHRLRSGFFPDIGL